MEIILYLSLTLLAVYFIIRTFLDLKQKLAKEIKTEIEDSFDLKFESQKKEMENRFYLSYHSLEKDLELKFFEFCKINISDIKKNTLAKNTEVLQDKQDESPKPKKSFRENLNKLREIREAISQGDQEKYRNIEGLANLPPLDAWREVDTAIADLESVEQFPTSFGVTDDTKPE